MGWEGRGVGGAGATYLKYAQSTIHSEYLQFLFDMFKKFGVILMDKPYFGTSIVKGKAHNYFSFTTRSLSIWNSFYNMWYSSGIKCVP
jgi:LAGLIDADG DNA endonuclease family